MPLLPLVDINLFNELPWEPRDTFYDEYEGDYIPATMWHPPEGVVTGNQYEATFTKTFQDVDGVPMEAKVHVHWAIEAVPDEEGYAEYELSLLECEVLTPINFQFVEDYGTPKFYVYDEEEMADTGEFWCEDLTYEKFLYDAADKIESEQDRRRRENLERIKREQEQQQKTSRYAVDGPHTLPFSEPYPAFTSHGRKAKEYQMSTRNARLGRRRVARDYQSKDYRKHTRSRSGYPEDQTISIWIADLAAYNAGRLKGEWVELPMDEDELSAIIDKHSRNRTQDWAIFDYEAPFPISEYDSPEALNRFMEEVNDAGVPLCIVAAALDQGVTDMAGAIEAAEEAQAIYASRDYRDLSYAYIEDYGDIENAVSSPEFYFDYEGYGRAIRQSDESVLDSSNPDEARILARYETMSDSEVGEEAVDDQGGVERLDLETIAEHFDHEAHGRDLEINYNYTFVKCADGDELWIRFD